MPVRNFSPALKNPSDRDADRIAIEFVPQPGDDPAADHAVIIELKHGATEDQAKALHGQLSLLGARMFLRPAGQGA